MGIFSKQSQSSAYVPPQTGGNSTLLGDSAQPAAGQYDDLNRSPATSVELRFRHVRYPGYDTGYDHAFIVVTDNLTGEQWVNQAGPWGPDGDPVLGSLEATTDEYKSGKSRDYDAPYKPVARFTTDASPESVKEKLEVFSDRFNRGRTTYELPPVPLLMVPPDVRSRLPTRNSNFYGGAVWDYLTSSVPKLPDSIDAPGWADHLRAPARRPQ